MGSAARERPLQLAEKLRRIRAALGLSQAEMLSHLGVDERNRRHYISQFETGKREPSLPLLLAYARCANVSTDVLIDDRLDLPAKLPDVSKRRVTKRK